MTYLLDANVFIQAKNLYYGFDFVPGFWSWLDMAFEQSQIRSITAVRDELVQGQDELGTWARDRGRFFQEIDSATTRHFTELSTWVYRSNFTQAARRGFTTSHTDFLLVTYARAHNLTLVTHETLSVGFNRVKIPNACQALGVEYTNTFDMLRQSQVRLTLSR
ncbi:DUF4411 family protein [Trueperella sp.]|uniref:DUF4411 family protein n=1 Tax=Trueperella sp. TaxID=2699835 RepID=UPI0022EA2368|nr:DUF4411 family protein [Trueperella sp.]